jgi:hypothetical protein
MISSARRPCDRSARAGEPKTSSVVTGGPGLGGAVDGLGEDSLARVGEGFGHPGCGVERDVVLPVFDRVNDAKRAVSERGLVGGPLHRDVGAW